MNKATLMVPDGSQFIQTFVNSEVIQTMDLSQFGFKLHFPPHTSLKPVTFTIGVSLSPWQDFIPPPNTTLVSALYYIKVSPGLLQPVIIEIQHCINPDWVKNTTLTFAKAHTDAFEKLSGGRFGRNSWGAIQLSNFSYLAIFTNSENATSRSVYYLAHILTSHHKGTPGIYQVDLVISRKLNAIKEVIKIIAI